MQQYKKTSILFNTFFGMFILLLVSSCGSSRRVITTTTPAVIRQAIDSNNWTFTPTRVLPQYGRSRQTDPTFFATSNNGKLTVYLPYFGRAYGGSDVLSSTGPLDFTSTDFTLDKQLSRVGEWRIAIKPGDNRQVQNMIFILYENGYAHLDVTMTNRSPISFDGNLSPANNR